MAQTWKNPAGAITPQPGRYSCKLNGSQNTKSPAPMESPTSWPVRLLAARFGLSLNTASTIAALTGLGGAV